MSILSVEPIPTRNWKNKVDRWELVVERDKNRKKSNTLLRRKVEEVKSYLKPE